MEDLNDKVTGNLLEAPEWNQVPSEIQNVIEGAGITLSAADLNQLGKAVAAYAAGGDFYTDSGIADAYVLSAVGAKQAPPAYFNGMRIRFVAGNANTGAATVNVAALGAVSLKDANGAALDAGHLAAGVSYTFRHDGADFVDFDQLRADLASTAAGKGASNVSLEGGGNVQNLLYGVSGHSISAGTVDAITAAFTPAVTSLIDGAEYHVRANGWNTSTTPTIKLDALAAKTIVKKGNQALSVRDIPRAGYEMILRYNLTNDNVELLNPGATKVSSQGPRSIVEYKDSTSVRVIESDAVMGGFRFKGKYKKNTAVSYPISGGEISISAATNLPFAMSMQRQNWYAAMACANAGDASVTAKSMPFFRVKSVSGSVITLGFAGEGYGTRGQQRILFSSTFTGATATGLANDATTYTASISINGSANAVSVVGSAAQTFTALLTEINADISGAAITLLDINNATTVLNVVNASTGLGTTSTIAITDTDLFSTLTNYSSIEIATVHTFTGVTNSYDWTSADLSGVDLLVITETVAGRTNAFSGRETTITSATATTLTIGSVGNIAVGDWLLPAPNGFTDYKYLGSFYIDTAELRNLADDGFNVRSKGILDFQGTNTGSVGSSESRNISGYVSPLASGVSMDSSCSLSTASTGSFAEYLAIDTGLHTVITNFYEKTGAGNETVYFSDLQVPFMFGPQYVYSNGGTLPATRISGQQNITGWQEK